MKAAEYRLALLGLLLFVPAAARQWQISGNAVHAEHVIVAGGCRVPVTVIHPSEPPVADAIVLHGLIANRRLMLPVARVLAAAGVRSFVLDLPGHGDNAQPFSFARAEECARAATQELARQQQIQLQRTIFLGHSMGGAIAIRLAEHFPDSLATIAFSPAPFNLAAWVPRVFVPFAAPRRVPANLLVLMAEFDLPLSERAARELIRQAGGPRDTPADFRARNAAKLAVIPASTHTSLLFTEPTTAATLRWISAARSASPEFAADPPPRWHIYAGLAGIALMLPLFASLLFRLFRASPGEPSSPAAPPRFSSAYWLLAGLGAAALLHFSDPLRWLKLYSGGYLASFLLLTGLLLAFFTRRNWSPAWPGATDCRQLLAAAGLAFTIVLAFGAWLDATTYDAWPNLARWWRIPLLALVCFPFAILEEWSLGPPAAFPLFASAAAARTAFPAFFRRTSSFLLRRFTLWLCLLFALAFLNCTEILLALMPIYFLFFSLGQRMAADVAWRRSSSVLAPALVNAILAGWLLSLFPLL